MIPTPPPTGLGGPNPLRLRYVTARHTFDDLAQDIDDYTAMYPDARWQMIELDRESLPFVLAEVDPPAERWPRP